MTLAEGWVRFRAGIIPMADLLRVPDLLDETMITRLRDPQPEVELWLPIVEDGNFVAIHG